MHVLAPKGWEDEDHGGELPPPLDCAPWRLRDFVVPVKRADDIETDAAVLEAIRAHGTRGDQALAQLETGNRAWEEEDPHNIRGWFPSCGTPRDVLTLLRDDPGVWRRSLSRRMFLCGEAVKGPLLERTGGTPRTGRRS
jgi:hypothetical protein